MWQGFWKKILYTSDNFFKSLATLLPDGIEHFPRQVGLLITQLGQKIVSIKLIINWAALVHTCQSRGKVGGLWRVLSGKGEEKCPAEHWCGHAHHQKQCSFVEYLQLAKKKNQAKQINFLTTLCQGVGGDTFIQKRLVKWKHCLLLWGAQQQ